MFINKYRTLDFDKIVGVPSSIKGLIGEEMPHFMFYGHPGTGKSLLSETIEKTLGWETLRINGSDDRGIDFIRNVVLNFMKTKSLNGKPKLIRFEEFDNVTSDSQKLLRDPLEKYANNCKIIFTLNYPDKVIDALHDRCVKINLDNKDKNEILMFLKDICCSENINFDDDGLKLLIKKFYPSIRSCLNKIEELSVGGSVTVDAIKADESKIKELFDLLMSKHYTKGRQWCLDSNKEASVITNELFNYVTENDVLDISKELSFVKALGETEFRLGLSRDKEVQLSAGLVRLIESLMV